MWVGFHVGFCSFFSFFFGLVWGSYCVRRTSNVDLDVVLRLCSTSHKPPKALFRRNLRVDCVYTACYIIMMPMIFCSFSLSLCLILPKTTVRNSFPDDWFSNFSPIYKQAWNIKAETKFLIHTISNESRCSIGDKNGIKIFWLLHRWCHVFYFSAIHFFNTVANNERQTNT